MVDWAAEEGWSDTLGKANGMWTSRVRLPSNSESNSKSNWLTRRVLEKSASKAKWCAFSCHYIHYNV